MVILTILSVKSTRGESKGFMGDVYKKGKAFWIQRKTDDLRPLS